jgi:energy-coupling factor transporter ATP-binding protein EcfA2
MLWRPSKSTSSVAGDQAELWHELKTEWDAATRRLEVGLQQAQAESAAQFADWAKLAGGGWSPAVHLPAGIRRGEYIVDLESWEHAIPGDMRLAPRSTRLIVPSITPFPEAASLLLRTATAESRSAATQLLQSLLLRWLTLVPPGKLRLTIIDPVGLGESFAGFMHLADFDELLVTKRIWTEPDQIEQQLADLTEHMENVLQKYLRNEFASIEEYNTFAGEVAEPYRVLVITDFPAKFSEIAARRLTSIISSGPRCGVFTLLSMDPRRDLPHGFDPAVLDEKLPALHWSQFAKQMSPISELLDSVAPAPAETAPIENVPQPGFRVAAGVLSRWPLSIDAPPPSEQFTSLVRRIGEASKDARRVEVSFDRIAPATDALWTHSSRHGIDIPLGRAGATKHQHLRLGKGTSQHMLIAGKTGSGKSTFLHCLITNLALHYSPDEVRFSLVDFKKGVEFKHYAAFQLPHADVIAIESDREFGVSVLQRLDGVLQERGDLFRKHGVQDLAGFRAAQPDVPLPRLMLVIDEFQEFFVEEDRLSQSAALLLDRLIRQGRAFGMHVVLGSQTLGGAYSLARSTMGQVAVRVALQCSEADAHLILSEENTAARLLTRPGEAIYNDANGLVEGNHPFQIAWLPDDQRETWLRRIQALAAAQGRRDAPPIVFEGNIPSDPARNAPLVRLLASRVAGGTADHAPASPQVWLGERSRSSRRRRTFDRRNARTLLVGQDADGGGIMTTAALTLAAQSHRPTGDVAPIIVLDGSPADSVEAAAWQALPRQFPGTIQVVGPRGTGEALRALADELQRRLAEPDVAHAPRFLFVHHMSRFRDLRKGDDDFGVSAFGGKSDAPVEPSKLFADLLSSGPVVGIHTLVWCDSANTVERWFSRSSLRELENRIVFQMNSSDSSNLVDSPAAAKLGVHRALLYREETGTSEKFRPYHSPDDGWLQSLSRDGMPAVVATPVVGGVGSGAPASDVAQDLSDFRIL